MKLDFITQDFPPATGGIQTYSYELVSRFAKMGVDLLVHAPSHKEAADFDQKQHFAVKRYKVHNPHLGFRLLLGYPNRLIKEDIDVVFHAQWPTVKGSLKARKKGAKTKIFCAVHGRELFINPSAIKPTAPLSQRFLQSRKLILQKVDHFFPVSNYTANVLREAGVADDKITVVPNGTNTSQYYLDEKAGSALRKKLGFEKRKIIFSVSRLVPTKGMDTIITSLTKVVTKHPDLLYLVGGSGPDRERLEEIVAQHNLSHHVHFTGRIPDKELNAYYNMSDLFCMMSRQNHPNVEGFGIVFLEANATGTPVIGSLTGGIPDAIEDGKSGFLVDANDPNALANQITQALNDTDLLHTMGQHGLHRVTEYLNWDAVARRLLHRIEELI